MRQEKTLALARALQTCAERSGMLNGVLCNSARELQRCMAPLMHLSGNEIVEASLLGPTSDKHGTFPTLEEEATILGEEPELPETPKATSLSEHLETPEPQRPQSRLMLSLQSPLSKLMLLVPLLPCALTWLPPFPDGNETPERDRS